MSEHECRIVFGDYAIARPWGVHCETCSKVIGACTSQQDAEDVLANHQRWQKLRENFIDRAEISAKVRV